MATTFNDSARPRFLPLTPRYKIELDYVFADPANGVLVDTIAAKTVVDSRGVEVSDERLFALVFRLLRTRVRRVVPALKLLLSLALRREERRRRAEARRASLAHVEMAEGADVDRELAGDVVYLDAPVSYDVADAPASDDPERPEPWRMDDEHVDAFAMELDSLQRQSITGRLLRSLDRAAGGSR